MKKILLLVMVGLFMHSVISLGQTTKGTIQLGLSTTLSLAGQGSDLMGLGFSSMKYKSNASGYTEPDPDKMTRFNLAPKIGYFIMDNLVLGADLYIAYNLEKDGGDDDKYSSTLMGIGPFGRYYMSSGKLLPFIEGSCFFGSMKNKYDPADGESSDSKSGIMAFGGGVGIAAPLGEKVYLDIMAGYNSFSVKDKEDNPDDNRVVVGTFGLKLGIIIFLGSN